jgi:hypothetical protein
MNCINYYERHKRYAWKNILPSLPDKETNSNDSHAHKRQQGIHHSPYSVMEDLKRNKTTAAQAIGIEDSKDHLFRPGEKTYSEVFRAAEAATSPACLFQETRVPRRLSPIPGKFFECHIAVYLAPT